GRRGGHAGSSPGPRTVRQADRIPPPFSRLDGRAGLTFESAAQLPMSKKLPRNVPTAPPWQRGRLNFPSNKRASARGLVAPAPLKVKVNITGQNLGIWHD